MERSEPSLVPEWLKGAGGGVGGASHHLPTSSNHQDESGGSFTPRQRVQPHGIVTGGSHVDYDSPRYPTSSSAYYSAVRRGSGGGSSSVNDRALQDRDTYSQHSRGYTNFGRSPAYRSYDGGMDRSERDSSRDRDWEWDRGEREGRERDRVLGGFGGAEDRDRDRGDRLDNSSGFRRPGLGSNSGARYEADITAPLRRVQSMGSAARALENGEKKAGVGELGGLPTAPPSNSGSLTSSMQKAAFERNFPSLGAQERGLVVSSMQSNLGSVAVLSPRPLWQGSSTPRLDGSRSSASSPGLPSAGTPGTGLTSTSGGSSGEGWSSALAEAPTALTGVTPAALNGISGTSSIANVSSASSAAVTSIMQPGTSLNPPKMVEALVQNPPRVRTPPQYSAETQRLEELALKQSRQLIPMKPSLPKNMGLSPRDKLPKPKVVRAVDVVAPSTVVKVRQPMAASQVPSSPYRPPALPRPDLLKPAQTAGKILVRKVSKDVAPVLSSSQATSGLKSDSSPLVASAVGVLGLSVGSAAIGGAPNMVAPPRKQKQLLDRRAVPIPPISVPVGLDGSIGGVRTKDGNSGTVAGGDERRPPMPTQNRVDFFNALRKKAGLSSTPNIVDKLDAVTPKKSDIVNGKDITPSPEESVNLSEDVGENSQVDSFQLENGENEQNDITADADMPAPMNKFFIEEKEIQHSRNGLIMEDTADEQLSEEAEATLQQQVTSSGATADEEEEAAFLRSLGWVENAEGGEDALTEEEINAFLEAVKHDRIRKNDVAPAVRVPSSNHHRKRMDLQVGSISSISSGMSSSESESDDDCHVQRR